MAGPTPGAGKRAPQEPRKILVDNSKMQFVLQGFSQVVGLRVFAFEGITTDHQRTPFTVSADLSVARRYGIRLQELPLLCRGVLERGHDGGKDRKFAYTEEEMRIHSCNAAAEKEAARKRKPFRRPVSSLIGGAWRSTPV